MFDPFHPLGRFTPLRRLFGVAVSSVLSSSIGAVLSLALIVTSLDAPADVSIAVTPMNSFLALCDLMWTPIFKKFRRETPSQNR